MNTWANAVITDKGLALQSKLTQGNSLNITRAVTGAGYVTPGLLTKQVDVSSPKQTLKFRPVSYPEAGKCAITMELTNNEVQTGYTALQVGVFAEDPDDGEILYFIAQAADKNGGTNVPSATEMPGYSAEWTFYFQYGQADTVNVTVDPANTITRTQAQQMLNESLVDYNLKTYTSLAQIGLSAGSETIESIVENLPDYSTLFMNVGADNADIYPVAYGALYVMKRDNTRTFFEFLEKTSARRYFGVYDSTMSDTWSGWEKFSTAAELNAHLNDKENPHAVTKKQVGLGNVPNVATNDQTPTYSDTTTLATLVSGEKLNVALQKIKCAITNLISHIGSHKMQTFISFADIGLTIGSETIEDIATKLPESSQLFVVVGADGADIYPTTYGTLHVLKKNTSRTYFEFLEKTNSRRYYGTYDSSMSTPWSGWAKSYSAHDKPTPADIGAVNKAGDTMTGELKLQDLANSSQCSRVYSSEGLGLGFLTVAGNTYSARTMLKINKPDVDKANLLRLAHATEEGDSAWYNIYGEHNRPTPTDIGIDDYVIEEGAKGIWAYRKWASGKKECWGTYSATISHSATWNGGYEYLSGNISLPFTFDRSPVVTFHGKVTTGNSVPGYVGMTESTVSMMLWASSSGSQPCYFFVHVIGK